MYLKQSDLFNGMSAEFIKQVLNISFREQHDTGSVLFKGGDYPEHFYILIQGRVQLTFGESEKQVYIGSSRGEFFGWSGLVGRSAYSASGECLETTDLFKINQMEFSQLLHSEPETKCLFYKNLASALGNRLMQTYEFLSQR